MNKFLTNLNGGLPLFLDDIRFLDDIYRNSIHAIVKGIADKIIISGINPTISEQNNLVTEEGFILYLNEILYVPANSVAYNENLEYVFRRSVTTSGTRIFSDQSENDVYELRTGYIEEIAPQNIQSSDLKVFSIPLRNLYEKAFSKNSAFNKSFSTDAQAAAGTLGLVLQPSNIVTLLKQEELVITDANKKLSTIPIKSALNQDYASQAQTLSGAAGVVISPQNLQQHTSFSSITGNGSWACDDLKVRKLTNGLYQLKGYFQAGGSSLPSTFGLMPVVYQGGDNSFGALAYDYSASAYKSVRIDIVPGALSVNADFTLAEDDIIWINEILN